MKIPKWSALCGVLLLASPSLAPALTLNLACPYSPTYSPPRSTDIAFTFPKQETAVFKTPEEAVIEISTPAQKYLTGKWKLFHNLVTTPLMEGDLSQVDDMRFVLPIPVDKLQPGFYDLQVDLGGDVTTGKNAQVATGTTTFGWKVDEMKPTAVAPKGFEEFWKKTVADIRALPLNLKVEFVQKLTGNEIDTYNRKSAGLPGNYDPAGKVYDEVEIYRVSFDSPNGGRVYAWFCKPVGDGPFPGLLVVPGAGNNPRSAPVEHARHGWAAMDVQVHGFPVDLPLYPPLPPNKPTKVEEHEGYRVYRNALMAVNALAALPGVDPSRLAVCGGSQGGRLTVVVSALDERIRAGVAAITHFSELPRLNWAKQMNKDKSNGGNGYTPIETQEGVAFDEWFDVSNFAAQINKPMLFNMGMIDRISPASCIQGAYSQIKGDKEIIYLPTMGHDWSPSFDRRAWKWLNAHVPETAKKTN